MFNDRPENEKVVASSLPKPEISIVVDGNRVFKPGMKTVFIDDDQQATVQGSLPAKSTGTGVITGSYCSCNTVQVCTCNTVCTCQAVSTYSGITCSCNPHCNCEGHCTCNTYTKPSSGGGGSCNGPCSCVPVH